MISPALPLESQATNPNPDPQRKPYVCPECWKEAVLSEEKRLPDEGAVLMKAVHTDKTIPDHTWKDYVPFDETPITIPSRPAATQTILSTRGSDTAKKPKKPTREKSERYQCPLCHKLAPRYFDKRAQQFIFEHRDESPIREYQYRNEKYMRKTYRRCHVPINLVSNREPAQDTKTKTISIPTTEHNELVKIRAEINEIRTKQKKIAAREKRIRTEQKALEADRKDLQRLLEV